MVGGVFACPECGGEVDVPGLTPGRQVVCARCATLVEVPFLRRRRHGRRGRRSEVYTLLMLGGGLAAVVVAGAIAWAVLAARERAGHRRAFDELAEASRRAEASGRAEDALRDSLAALELARRTKLEGSFVDELREHRDVLAVREIRARLAALDSAEPRAALGEALTLQRRTVIDAAISDYAAAADEAVARARLRVIAAELEAAREAVSGERPAEAIAACERLLEAAEASSPPEAGSARTEALAIATGIATRFGMIVEPTKGRFTLGSPQGFTKAFGDALGDALRARGFLLPPRSPALVQVWSTAAPYHFVVDVI